MTREEYINFANALKNNYTIDFDKLPEFCDMAIAALKAQGEMLSCPRCGLDVHSDFKECPRCGADLRGE